MKRLFVIMVLLALGVVAVACSTAQPVDDPVGVESEGQIAGRQGFATNIVVWHDDERDVTCWVAWGATKWKGGIGISCIPDRILQGGE